MTPSLIALTSPREVRARVETVVCGDEVWLPGFMGGWKLVLGVEEYGDPQRPIEADEFVVVYEDDVEHSWENRARDKARWNMRSGRFEKGLRSLRRGERVLVRRRPT